MAIHPIIVEMLIWWQGELRDPGALSVVSSFQRYIIPLLLASDDLFPQLHWVLKGFCEDDQM